METLDKEKADETTPTKRILCIGKITKGRMTMAIAFHKKGGTNHVPVSRRRIPMIDLASLSPARS
ncbi:MAG: hypothetical protein WA133_05995 [Syntrophales bacterium]